MKPKTLREMSDTLASFGRPLHVVYGDPVDQIPELAQRLGAETVYFNRDYTPYTKNRDDIVSDRLLKNGIHTQTYRDHVMFEPDDLLKKDGTPYKMFTPYFKQWETALHRLPDRQSPYIAGLSALGSRSAVTALTADQLLETAGFVPNASSFKGGSQDAWRRLDAFAPKLAAYKHDRDFPCVEGTSGLSVYLRHGCLSIRDLINTALAFPTSGSATWIKELAWREFYQMITWHFPHVVQAPFNADYNDLNYPENPEWIQRWKDGQTGFPIVDAAMRCLNQTGWMHNRLRMVTASFLSKLLLQPWKAGERYFAWKLVDYEFSSNNGGWQWASGSGCDAAPYFRLFNPYTQSKTYDPDGAFIKQYCPELKGFSSKDIHFPQKAKTVPSGFKPGQSYPDPIVDYSIQRKNALAFFKSALA